LPFRKKGKKHHRSSEHIYICFCQDHLTWGYQDELPFPVEPHFREAALPFTLSSGKSENNESK